MTNKCTTSHNIDLSNCAVLFHLLLLEYIMLSSLQSILLKMPTLARGKRRKQTNRKASRLKNNPHFPVGVMC